jgi:hypothetical protein
MRRPRHRWTEGDDLVALYLSRHGYRFLPLMQAGVAKLLGMPEGSLVMRQSNFAYLDGRDGLDHAAEQSREVRQRYGKMTEPELRPLVLKVLDANKGAR